MNTESYKALFNNKITREILREKGQFWTPEWVAQAMVVYVAKASNYIFDPSIGTGAFYKAAKKQFNNNNKLHFYGIDIDKNLLIDELYKNEDCSVEVRDFIKNPPKRKFKSIVANPPYIRHHRIDNETKLLLKNICRKITGFEIDGRAGLHIYFLLQALNLLETDGRLSFIMPSDTCEGIFAKKLWKWISENYRIESVITFEPLATPFPNVDTNAIVFMIQNSNPKSNLSWVRVLKSGTNDLLEYVKNDFRIDENTHGIKIYDRELQEAIDTGLTRESPENNDAYKLIDFAIVRRGIATGANEFFLFNEEEVRKYQIPEKYLYYAVGRTRDVPGFKLTDQNIEELRLSGRPIFLLNIQNEDYKSLPTKVKNYLDKGLEDNINERALIKTRKPWYKMEYRKPPEILFAYLGRRNSRFILNEAKALPLTGFLCVYPRINSSEFVQNLFKILNSEETIENLKYVGKSYGGGAVKVEPRALEQLRINSNLVKQYKLDQYVTELSVEQLPLI